MKIVFNIFWIFITVGSLQAQGIEQTIHLAEVAFEESRYNEAVSYYQRVIFFDQDGKYDSLTIEGLAWSSYLSGDYDLAAKYFRALSRVEGATSAEVMEILSLIKQGSFLDAKRSVLALRPRDDAESLNKLVLISLIDFQLGNHEQAQRNFSRLNEMQQMSYSEEVYQQVKKLEKKTKVKAILLSAFIPGAGQVYSRHYKEGFNSMVTITAFGTFYILTIHNYGLAAGLISVLPWFQRYYVGGMNSAADLLQDYKDEQFDLLYNELVKNYAHLIEVDFE